MTAREHPDVHFVDWLIAVDIGDPGSEEGRRRLQSAIDALAEVEPEARPPEPERLASDFEADAETVRRMMGLVGLLEVTSALTAAETLANNGFNASPVHAMGYQWHTVSAPGPAEPRGDFGWPELTKGEPDKVIAVVDSGIAPEAHLPPFIRDSLEPAPIDQVDVETLAQGDPAGHGTFVVGLIRLIAPSHRVSIVKAAAHRRADWLPTERDHDLIPGPTTEWHVSSAILRLIHRHRGGAIAALNLSLGGASWNPGSDTAMVMLRIALDRFREAFPTAEIFAAAGNGTGKTPFYPAAFPDVRGVAAAKDGDSTPIVWDTNIPPNEQPADERSWVSDVAPGSKLLGPTGKSEMGSACWSGSSFASAVAVACHVNGGPVQVTNGVAYWPDRAMDYANVDGLVPCGQE